MPDGEPESRDEIANDASNDARPRRQKLAIAVLVGVALLLVVDLVADAGSAESALHIVLELGAALAALGAGARLWAASMAERRELEARVADLHRELGSTRADADRLRADAERWKTEARDALGGLGAAIDRQCDRWELTAAEREVALLLLKGLSLKEVASVRGTSERTARQQSLAVYRKAGLAGRAELAAFFLEDLLLPAKPSSVADGSDENG